MVTRHLLMCRCIRCRLILSLLGSLGLQLLSLSHLLLLLSLLLCLLLLGLLQHTRAFDTACPPSMLRQLAA